MNVLYVATAGSATSRPTPVATSASAMPDITACVPCERVAGEIVERADDAEHGAEQTDERRVVAERAEEREPLLVAQPLGLERSRPCAPRRPRDHRRRARGRRARPRPPSSARPRASRAPRAGPCRESARSAAASCSRGRALLDEEPDALEDHRDRGEREREQEPQHPARAGAQHEVEELGVDRVSLFIASPVRTGRAGRRSEARSG